MQARFLIFCLAALGAATSAWADQPLWQFNSAEAARPVLSSAVHSVRVVDVSSESLLLRSTGGDIAWQARGGDVGKHTLYLPSGEALVVSLQADARLPAGSFAHWSAADAARGIQIYVTADLTSGRLFASLLTATAAYRLQDTGAGQYLLVQLDRQAVVGTTQMAFVTLSALLAGTPEETRVLEARHKQLVRLAGLNLSYVRFNGFGAARRVSSARQATSVRRLPIIESHKVSTLAMLHEQLAREPMLLPLDNETLTWQGSHESRKVDTHEFRQSIHGINTVYPISVRQDRTTGDIVGLSGDFVPGHVAVPSPGEAISAEEAVRLARNRLAVLLDDVAKARDYEVEEPPILYYTVLRDRGAVELNWHLRLLEAPPANADPDIVYIIDGWGFRVNALSGSVVGNSLLKR